MLRTCTYINTLADTLCFIIFTPASALTLAGIIGFKKFWLLKERFFSITQLVVRPCFLNRHTCLDKLELPEFQVQLLLEVLWGHFCSIEILKWHAVY